MKNKFYLIFLLCCLLLVGCSNSKSEEEINNQAKELGHVEPINVEEFVTIFNNQIFNDSGLGPTSNEHLAIVDNQYWYGITDGIYLVIITPTKATTKENDIVSSTRIYVDKEYKDDPQVLAYANILIMANNSNITISEAQNLIDEAIRLSSDNLTSNNGKGIAVGYLETDNHNEYQVIRLYE